MIFVFVHQFAFTQNCSEHGKLVFKNIFW